MAKNVSELGVYEIKVNKLSKEVQILVEGTMTPKQSDEFIAEYQKTVSMIKAEDFVLRLDCKDLTLVSSEMVPALTFCYEMYRDTGFEKVIFEISSVPIIKMQMGRLARAAKLKNHEIIVVG